MEVEELLRKVAAVYATCRSYRDRGTVTRFTVASAPGQLRTTTFEFETAWLRPDRFRFEFVEGSTSSPMRYVVWWNGGEIRSWWTVRNEIKVFDELPSAVDGPTWMTQGVARLVPELLCADGFERLAAQHSGTPVVEELEGEAPCFVLGGDAGIPMTPGHRAWTWIDARTYLIRRIDSQDDSRPNVALSRADPILRRQGRAASNPVRFRILHIEQLAERNPEEAARLVQELQSKSSQAPKDFRRVQTIRYSPELDPDLAPEVFEFEPPTS